VQALSSTDVSPQEIERIRQMLDRLEEKAL
jgi:hypothetical protein